MPAAAVAKKHPDWQRWEDEIILKEYQRSGLDAVTEMLPARSRVAVMNRAYRLGASGRIWTDKEDNVIRRCYPEAGSKYCQRYMPWRTVLAIRSRAFVLGVKRDPSKANSKARYGDIMLAEKLVRKRWVKGK